MKKEQKKENIVKKLERHLKSTSRQLVQFDSEEETLQYISDSFREKLSADFVGIVVKSDGQLTVKSWSGAKRAFINAFPLNVDQCSPNLFLSSLTHEQLAREKNCAFTKLLQDEKIPTWFTFPLKNELNLFGFCIIGYFQKVMLFEEMESVFDEFGKDVAIAMLFQREKQHKHKLHQLLLYQQTLVKETIHGSSIDEITETLNQALNKSVILLDRFLRPISYKLSPEDEGLLDEYLELATYEIVQKRASKAWNPSALSGKTIAYWTIDVGGDFFGYLVLDVSNAKMDDYFRLTIDVARNIYSIQFMKQKIILDTKEQVRDSFINKILSNHLDEIENVYQYANLFRWDIERPHYVAILSLTILDEKLDILEQESCKSRILEKLKTNLSNYFPEVFIVNKEGDIVLIAPASSMNGQVKSYWSKMYENLKKWVKNECEKVLVLLAVGGKTNQIPDYSVSYLQAKKCLNVVKSRFNDAGFALFDELGAYALLHEIDGEIASIFIQDHIGPLLNSEGKNMDLLQTLQVYLSHNGNMKETANELFIHRSTLQYRLEKIEDLLQVDLNNAEHRFNLNMAIKLYNLFGNEIHVQSLKL
ncbi:helix-turn-helix domain-containing protein [Ureibacillus terrenus]|uniref:PucR family transcriptional regulator n=1 Tax=Ureibacillus terrenus TaxID=118246 RepID=A0A540V0M1_9BACL|nr:helix-turn-helix domain-containing protein [Ureibacillus terrenus]TQE90257.1 PucR family transcriptional regulator [Ureibacillus terrenus]